MIVHTSAIVFKTLDYQESSKIVTLFTEEHGKIAVIVKGAKKLKNKFSGLLEVGNLLDVVYYYKSSRSIQILTEASFLEKTLNIRLDFKKMATATSAIELISQLLHENEINKPLFTFTKNFLTWLDKTESAPQKIFPYVQIRLAQLMGLGLKMQVSDSPRNSSYYISLETGLISQENTSNSTTYKLTQNQVQYVSLALQARGSRLFELDIRPVELKELVQHLDRYLKYHVEGLRDRKADAIFEQILQE